MKPDPLSADAWMKRDLGVSIPKSRPMKAVPVSYVKSWQGASVTTAGAIGLAMARVHVAPMSANSQPMPTL